MNSPTKRIIERKLNRRMLIGRSPVSKINNLKRSLPQSSNDSGDFLPVMLNEVPADQCASSEQIEIWLPDGTRIIASGEKCISLFSSIIKESL